MGLVVMFFFIVCIVLVLVNIKLLDRHNKDNKLYKVDKRYFVEDTLKDNMIGDVMYEKSDVKLNEKDGNDD